MLSEFACSIRREKSDPLFFILVYIQYGKEKEPVIHEIVSPWFYQMFFGKRRGCDVRLVAAEAANGGFGVQVVLEKEKEM